MEGKIKPRGETTGESDNCCAAADVEVDSIFGV